MNKKSLLTLACCLLSVVAGSIVAFATPPSISAVQFPNQFQVNTSRAGQISFESTDHDVAFARFDVADGRYYRQVVSSVSQTDLQQGKLSFSLDCTAYGQKVSLAVTLFNGNGEKSEPYNLTFLCGEPSVYNFDAEQAEALSVNERIPLNFFIVDDGVTALAEDAVFTNGSILGRPSPRILDAIRNTVIPKLTGIWDQCNFGFDLINVWVVRPQDIQISGQSLDQQLFSSQQGQRVIQYGRESADLLRQATYQIWRAAQGADARAANGFNVLLIGAGIMTSGVIADESEGFSESVWPNYAVVRSGTIVQDILPKQMISTLAHELGHNLGLVHPGQDDLYETLTDPMNLMAGSGVSPQPRANLLQRQCDRAHVTYTALKERLVSQTNQQSTSAPAQTAGASVTWKETCPQLVCAGKVELSVDTQGFQDLLSFGFASFEYSTDGEHFTEIGVDRRCQDGFSMTWDTSKLADGHYTLRVEVTDAKGVRASVKLDVAVKNS
ncbi:hypothetical protein HY229_01855 [Candidatus Acetothermia bacterium]|nr:hypothetical protein [Candidatus Acetothermia bacterium]MBI3642832.1 hypothetical protein [Candidatus Acetothermia bacterium]